MEIVPNYTRSYRILLKAPVKSSFAMLDHGRIPPATACTQWVASHLAGRKRRGALVKSQDPGESDLRELPTYADWDPTDFAIDGYIWLHMAGIAILCYSAILSGREFYLPFARLSQTPSLSFAGPMWGNKAPHEVSVNVQLASQNPFLLQRTHREKNQEGWNGLETWYE